MEHSLQITLTKEWTNLLTSAGDKFGLLKMAEKIKTCDRRTINGGHNIIWDVAPMSPSSTLVLGAAMSLRATMEG